MTFMTLNGPNNQANMFCSQKLQ